MGCLVLSEVVQGSSSGEETGPQRENWTANDEEDCRKWQKIMGARF